LFNLNLAYVMLTLNMFVIELVHKNITIFEDLAFHLNHHKQNKCMSFGVYAAVGDHLIQKQGLVLQTVYPGEHLSLS